MSGFLLIGLIVVVWLVVLAPLLLRGQKPIRKAGEAFDETRVILEGGSSVPMRPRPRFLGDSAAEEVEEEDLQDEDYEIADSPSIFRHRREDQDDVEEDDEEQTEIPESTEVDQLAGSSTRVDMDIDDLDETTAVTTELVAVADVPAVEVLEEWVEEDHYPMDDSYTAPVDFLHHEERTRAIAEYRAANNAQQSVDTESSDNDDYAGELTQADMEFAERRRGRGYYDPLADRKFAHTQYLRRQRTLVGLGAIVLFTVILGFVLGGGMWALPAIAIAMTTLYLVALRGQVRAENDLRARRIRRLRRSRMGVRGSEDLPQRLRRPGAVVLELDDESPDFEGLATTYIPVEEHEDRFRSHRNRRVS